jgi:hypothetical protein
MPDRNIRYNYCIILLDSYSLWVSAYPLRNLTAKSICAPLINTFLYTGLSSEVTVMSKKQCKLLQIRVDALVSETS